MSDKIIFNLVCVYGTLRKGQVNYRKIITAFGSACLSYKKTLTLPGWKMYDELLYPYIVRSSNLRDSIVVEVFTCTNRVYDAIKNMEIGAGYYADIISIDNEWHTIYAKTSRLPGHEQIDNGDWIEHLESPNPTSQFSY